MTILLIFICMVFNAFFAGLETGLISANQYTLYAKKEKKVLYAMAADFLLLKPERLLSTTLIGTNISVVTAAVILNSYLRELHLSRLAWVGSIVLSIVLLVFSEVIPKSFFRRFADTVSVRLAPLLVIFYFLFFPLSVILNGVVMMFLFFSGNLKKRGMKADNRRDLRLLVRLGGKEAGIPVEDRKVIEDIFDFDNTLVREVMVQIHETRLLPDNFPIADLFSSPKIERFYPVYRNRVDNIIGYIDTEEAVLHDNPLSADMMKPAVFFPDIKRITSMLQEMNREQHDLIFAVNEHGRITGYVTVNQITAEIVGPAPGENPGWREAISPGEGGVFFVQGDTDIEDFRHQTGLEIATGPYDTFGGYLCFKMGYIPKPGEILEDNGFRAQITDGDGLRVKRVKVQRKQNE